MQQVNLLRLAVRDVSSKFFFFPLINQLLQVINGFVEGKEKESPN